MSNFNFSQSLEISIIEHRLHGLFEMLDKLEIPLFFPSILFNETFWQSHYEKKLSVLSFSQNEWLGNRPEQRSYLYKDDFYLELVHSIKLTTFSNSKFNIDTLLEMFKAKNNYVLSEFESFGDSKGGPMHLLNQIAQNYVRLDKAPKSSINPVIMGKLSAVKFYTRFVSNKDINGISITIRNSEKYWESFFKSIHSLDVKQKTNVLQKTNFYFLAETQNILEDFISNLPSYPHLHELYTNGQIQFDLFDAITFDPNVEIDYIYSMYGLSRLPTETLIKYNRDVYNTLGRIVYADRKDEKSALEKIAQIQSPIKGQTVLSVDDIAKLDYEMILQKYTNNNAIDLIEGNYDFIDRTILRFSVPIFTFLVHAIKSLRPKGYIEAWDVNENSYSKYSLALFRNEYGELQSLVNFNLYISILNSFSDISFQSSVRSINDILTDEIMESSEKVVPLDKIFRYVTESADVSKKFFSVKNLTFYNELKKIHKSVDFFEFLKRKKIMLLGIPSLFYGVGFKKFKQKVLSHQVLSGLVKAEMLENNGLYSYLDEYAVALVPQILENAASKKDILVTRNKNSKVNKEFYDVLESCGLDSTKILEIIDQEWEPITKFAEETTNFNLLEIIKE